MDIKVSGVKFYPEELRRKIDTEKYQAKGTCEVLRQEVVATSCLSMKRPSLQWDESRALNKVAGSTMKRRINIRERNREVEILLTAI